MKYRKVMILFILLLDTRNALSSEMNTAICSIDIDHAPKLFVDIYDQVTRFRSEHTGEAKPDLSVVSDGGKPTALKDALKIMINENPRKFELRDSWPRSPKGIIPQEEIINQIDHEADTYLTIATFSPYCIKVTSGQQAKAYIAYSKTFHSTNANK